MCKLTAVIGLLLVILGGVAYAWTNGASATALIPVGFGAVYVILGLTGEWKPPTRKHVMHVAALLSLIGVAANVMAVVAAVKLLAGGQAAHPVAVYSRAIMGVLCAMHLIAAIRSFVVARLLPGRQNASADTAQA